MICRSELDQAADRVDRPIFDAAILVVDAAIRANYVAGDATPIHVDLSAVAGISPRIMGRVRNAYDAEGTGWQASACGLVLMVTPAAAIHMRGNRQIIPMTPADRDRSPWEDRCPIWRNDRVKPYRLEDDWPSTRRTFCSGADVVS